MQPLTGGEHGGAGTEGELLGVRVELGAGGGGGSGGGSALPARRLTGWGVFRCISIKAIPSAGLSCEGVEAVRTVWAAK